MLLVGEGGLVEPFVYEPRSKIYSSSGSGVLAGYRLDVLLERALCFLTVDDSVDDSRPCSSVTGEAVPVAIVFSLAMKVYIP